MKSKIRQYQEMRNYGFNHIIKKYADFPWYLPLPAHMEHGWTIHTEALKSDLKTDKPLMLVFSQRRQEAWRKESKIPAKIMGSPYIHFKNMQNIKKGNFAKGTVAFPSHSTYDVFSYFEIEKYCEELKNLPKEFKPLTICLFYLDYIDKKANIYRKHGFEVVTAGYKFSNSLDFVKNFYDILSKHKYATSNTVGSYSFCAVDLNIPFFLRGDRPALESKSDINVLKYIKSGESGVSNKANRLFSTGPIREITPEQMIFVKEEMGTGDCLSPEQMNKLLWKYSTMNAFYLKNIILFLISSLFAYLFFNTSLAGLMVWCKKKTNA